MALKSYRPLTPVQRTRTTSDFSDVTKKTPEKSLLKPLRKTGGRNNTGRITTRHRGGGHKRMYRVIDFKRRKHDVSAKVVAIEYDPNRSARIALVEYEDGEKSYILAPTGLKVGAKVMAGETAPPELGNALPLSKIPLGTSIHNVELTPGRGGKIARSAGQQVILSSREKGYALVRMPSGELRKIRETAFGTIGQVGNADHMNISDGKAGKSRWKGKRPTVRGMAMNPVDHPNGGGEGRSKSGGGRQHPRSPWGQLAKGQKTRHKHKSSDSLIVERRKSKKKR